MFCVFCLGFVEKALEVSDSSHASSSSTKPLLSTNDDDDDEAGGVRGGNAAAAANDEVRVSLNQKLIDGDAGNSGADDEREAPPQFREIFSFSHAFWILTASCVIVYGCVLPFNNIASSLLLERNYFMEIDTATCFLTDPAQCQSATNLPVSACPTGQYYQPPLPSNFTASDVDCSDTYWSSGCASDYCTGLTKGEVQASTVMSIPYIISASLR